MMCEINRLCLGLKIVQDEEPCVVIGNEFVNLGRGKSFNRVKYRKLISGKVFSKIFKSGDFIELANIDELDLVYLYNDSIYWYFMHPKNFEQISVPFEVIKNDVKKWLIEELSYTVIFWNDNPVFLIPPRFIELKVVDIQSVIKGDTISLSTKLALLSTGVVVKVPLFIKLGEYIKVDTRVSEYVSRVK